MHPVLEVLICGFVVLQIIIVLCYENDPEEVDKNTINNDLQ